MIVVQNILSLGKQTFVFITHLWYFSVPLFLLCSTLTVYGVRSGSAEEKRKMMWLPLLYLFPVMHLLLGVVFERHGSTWPSYLNYALLFSFVPGGVLAVVRSRGFRVMTIAHCLLGLWFSFFACLVAGMAIAGESL